MLSYIVFIAAGALLRMLSGRNVPADGTANALHRHGNLPCAVLYRAADTVRDRVLPSRVSVLPGRRGIGLL